MYRLCRVLDVRISALFVLSSFGRRLARDIQVAKFIRAAELDGDYWYRDIPNPLLDPGAKPGLITPLRSRYLF
jgi:hypothetical protein